MPRWAIIDIGSNTRCGRHTEPAVVHETKGVVMIVLQAMIGSVALAIAGLISLLVSEQANAEYAVSDLKSARTAA